MKQCALVLDIDSENAAFQEPVVSVHPSQAEVLILAGTSESTTDRKCTDAHQLEWRSLLEPGTLLLVCCAAAAADDAVKFTVMELRAKKLFMLLMLRAPDVSPPQQLPATCAAQACDPSVLCPLLFATEIVLEERSGGKFL